MQSQVDSPVINVIVVNKIISVKLLSITVADNIFRYQFTVNPTTLGTSAPCSVMSDSLNGPFDIYSREGCFIINGEILIRTGQFTLVMKVVNTSGVVKFTCDDLISKWLPAIVKAYINNTINYANDKELETLNKLKLTIKPGNSVDKMKKSLCYNYGGIMLDVDRIHTRHEESLKNVWTFSVEKNGSDNYVATINRNNGTINVCDVDKSLIAKCGAEIVIDTGRYVLFINCVHAFSVTLLSMWIRLNLFNLVEGICKYSLDNYIWSEDDKNALTCLSLEAYDAKKIITNRLSTVVDNKTDKTDNIGNIGNTDKVDTAPVKYLSGLARARNVLGFTTIRFGAIMKKCVLELQIPNQVSIKYMDAGKFAMVRVKRTTSDPMDSVQIMRVDSKFNIANEKLQVQVDGYVLEYYITYDNKYIETIPISIDFEFNK